MPQTHKREPLNSSEENLLRNSCKTPIETLVIFTLLDTGLRVSEFCQMKKENIDWQSHRIVIFGKGGKRRVIPLSPNTQRILEPWITVNGGIGFKSRNAHLIVKRVANRAGLVKKCSPHVLRHTFACNCIKKGISLTTLKTILGHSDLQTTFIYMNMSPENAIEEFGKKW